MSFERGLTTTSARPECLLNSMSAIEPSASGITSRRFVSAKSDKTSGLPRSTSTSPAAKVFDSALSGAEPETAIRLIPEPESSASRDLPSKP